ncbi:MAG: YcaO-like family protein [Sedimentitalea sp.]|uniref:YcaO-like family protein n=1 Tax=Sedimentitalea sp. TaxID=2048915 RepID=UPI003265271C
MFRGSLPDVPNLFVHASVTRQGNQPISATGIGCTPQEAELRHDGERAERVAQALGATPDTQDNVAISGMAAGRDDVAQIETRAILELVERWTCLSWWAGTLLASKPSPATNAAFAKAEANWKRRKPRRTGLLQLGQPNLPPAFVAWSCDQTGRSLCFGAACELDNSDAATAALRELYQMEFGLSVAQHRQAAGVALSGFEQRVLDRAESLTIEQMNNHFKIKDHADNRFRGDIGASLSDAGIALSVNRLTQPIDGHQIVTATSADLAPLSQDKNQCNTALRWNLYGA